MAAPLKLGLASAAAMGAALKRLGLPVDELGDGGRNMQADTEGRRSLWLRGKAADMSDGESLIVEPTKGETIVEARVKIAEWPSLRR